MSPSNSEPRSGVVGEGTFAVPLTIARPPRNSLRIAGSRPIVESRTKALSNAAIRTVEVVDLTEAGSTTKPLSYERFCRMKAVTYENRCSS